MAETHRRRGETAALKSTVSTDRLSRTVVRLPNAIPAGKGEQFVLKLARKRIIFLSKSKPIRSQTVMQHDVLASPFQRLKDCQAVRAKVLKSCTPIEPMLPEHIGLGCATVGSQHGLHVMAWSHANDSADGDGSLSELLNGEKFTQIQQFHLSKKTNEKSRL